MIRIFLTTVLCSVLISSCQSQTNTSSLSDEQILRYLQSLIYGNGLDNDIKALEALDKDWEDGMIAPLVEIQRFTNNAKQAKYINELLQKKTGLKHSAFFEWMGWLWEDHQDLEPYYYDFKADIYRFIDPKFSKYFEGRHGQANIRLEEVVWGGVVQDGIPPLRNPDLLEADQADYLSDTDIVFGAYINGVAKAYPKRILAWHEMFVDQFGDDLICGVYCTLCGTVIAYNTEHNGVTHDLGTSGFLYKSNKLMYDKATQSMWNTIEGKPVLGPLYDSGIELDVLPIVTSTWGEWKSIHPDTKVLSLNTGHDRDYGEGVAYQNYFNNDDLMFPVPQLSEELLNKDEVLIIRTEGYREDPLAISIKYMKKKKWYTDKVGNTNFIVIADKSGASRVYGSEDIQFKSYKKGQLIDKNGQEWKISHDKLTGPKGKVLTRLPSHNTFWFAWYNTYPETRLVK
jgi:hypothetical protein